MFPSFESILPSLQPSISDIKKQRKKSKGIIFSSFLLLALLVLFFYIKTGKIIALIFGAIVIVFPFVFIFLLVQNKFKHLYANQIVGQLVEALFQHTADTVKDSNFKYHASYNHKKFISRETIHKSHMFVETASFSGEDYIEGQVGLTDFKFSEVRIMNPSNGDNGESTAFKGVVFIADFHKEFTGKTYVLRQRFFNSTTMYPKWIGAFNIELADNEFNRAFVTRTTDDVEARYILSSNFARTLLDYSNRLNGKVEFVFIDSKMYIFRETKKDHFSGKLFNGNDEDVLRQIYEDFIEYFNLVDELTLNRRIWSKE